MKKHILYVTLTMLFLICGCGTPVSVKTVEIQSRSVLSQAPSFNFWVMPFQDVRGEKDLVGYTRTGFDTILSEIKVQEGLSLTEMVQSSISKELKRNGHVVKPGKEGADLAIEGEITSYWVEQFPGAYMYIASTGLRLKIKDIRRNQVIYSKSYFTANESDAMNAQGLSLDISGPLFLKLLEAALAKTLWEFSSDFEFRDALKAYAMR